MLALAAFALPGVAAAQVAPPRLAVRTIEQLPRPLAAPYDPAANPRAAIAAATERARKSGKRLLIDFGANWCIDCRVFASVVELPEMRPWIARHFELVTVDVGQFDRNLDIAARYGISLEAVPAIFVVNPQTGKLLNRAEVLSLGDASLLTPPQMAAWLARWAKR
ncbi:MAG: thioredoxin family protein [Sphingomonadales bacterium]|nr:MAG: thioredoxin family protein [Sphingomonadales bacterium]